MLMLAIVFFFWAFERVMRKLLHLKKRKLFSYNYVNSRHKKIDWIIRGIFILAIIVGGVTNISRLPKEPIWFLEPYILLFVLIFTSEIVRAVMEWKYAEERNAYILTVLQLVLLTILLAAMYLTDFFGLFPGLLTRT